MTNEIYIVIREKRFWLMNSQHKRVGSRFGYLSKRKAEAARWWLINGREAIQATYRQKREMASEMNHFKNI